MLRFRLPPAHRHRPIIKPNISTYSVPSRAFRYPPACHFRHAAVAGAAAEMLRCDLARSC